MLSRVAVSVEDENFWIVIPIPRCGTRDLLFGSWGE
jgi:hypothetical protein